MTKISIITINYNDLKGLQKTFNSVVNQTNKDFEYIVIDGGSSDGGKEFLEQNSDPLAYWISEKDSGVYNAMNKGIKAAKGEYLLFLNSGDFLVDDDVIEKVIENIDSKHSFYYGNLFYSLDDKRTLIWTPPAKLSFSYFFQHSLPHPASFIKRDLFEKYFLYNEKYKIVSDWEFFIYCICKMDEPYKYININIADFDNSGISSTSNNMDLIQSEKEDVFNKYFQQFNEDYKSFEVCTTKRFKQIKIIKENKFKWSLLKGLINLLYVSESNEKLEGENYFKQL
jgi:glycosyltransferase involved in cell wall biosynthesis